LTRAGLDLGITKTASVASIPPGGTFDYTIVVHNHGLDIIAQDGAQVVDTLPAGVSPTSVPAGCSYTEPTLTCLVGNLASGADYTVVVSVKVETASGTIVNKALVDMPQDTDASNNESTATVSVGMATPVPILSSGGVILLIGLLALTALPYRRKQASSAKRR
jgi:uncharacterized repeat protein (TIGR01451 family)